jgi:hypothetical protein
MTSTRVSSRESEESGPPGGRAEVGHDHSLLVPFDRDAPRGAVPIERVLVGVPAEQIARAEEKIAGVHYLTALLTWFQTDTGVRVVDLAATPEGARLYQLAGFRERAFPSMRLLMQQPSQS